MSKNKNSRGLLVLSKQLSECLRQSSYFDSVVCNQMKPITVKKGSYPTPRCPTCGVVAEPAIKRCSEGDKLVCRASGDWSVKFVMPTDEDIRWAESLGFLPEGQP